MIWQWDSHVMVGLTCLLLSLSSSSFLPAVTYACRCPMPTDPRCRRTTLSRPPTRRPLAVSSLRPRPPARRLPMVSPLRPRSHACRPPMVPSLRSPNGCRHRTVLPLPCQLRIVRRSGHPHSALCLPPSHSVAAATSASLTVAPPCACCHCTVLLLPPP